MIQEGKKEEIMIQIAPKNKINFFFSLFIEKKKTNENFLCLFYSELIIFFFFN